MVSVIIPSHGRVNYLKEALTTIYNQKKIYDFELEVFVIDDGSKPSLSSQLKKDFKKVNFVVNKGPRHGPGASRNIGLRLAKGDYIAFLDSDDQWKDKFLTISINTLKKSNSIGVVSLSRPYFYGNFPVIQKLKLLLLNLVKSSFILLFYYFNKGKMLKNAFYLMQISHVLFTNKIKKLKFNEISVAAEDWEFMVNASKIGSFSINSRQLVNFRYEIGSNTFSEIVRLGKNEAYYSLLNNLDKEHGTGLMNILFKIYIKYFLVR